MRCTFILPGDFLFLSRWMKQVILLEEVHMGKKTNGQAVDAEGGLYVTASKKPQPGAPELQGNHFCQQPELERGSFLSRPSEENPGLAHILTGPLGDPR